MRAPHRCYDASFADNEMEGHHASTDKSSYSAGQADCSCMQCTDSTTLNLALLAYEFPGVQGLAQGRLAALTHAGLLTSHQHSHGGQTWNMHASIRDAACNVADELGISCLAAKYASGAPCWSF